MTIHMPFLFWEIPSCEICRAVFFCGKRKEENMADANVNRVSMTEKQKVKERKSGKLLF